MIYRHILLRYLAKPVFMTLAIIVLVAWWLHNFPILGTDMLSNMLVGIMATVVVAGYTVVAGMVTDSWPVLRRAWLFKGHRHFNVAYADAVPAIVALGTAPNPPHVSAAALQVVFRKPQFQNLPQLPPFSISRPVPNSEVRAFKYLVKGFPEIDFDNVPDTEAMGLDAPLIAFGGEGSNYCTNQIMIALGFSSVWETGSPRSAYRLLAAAVLATPRAFEYGVIAVTSSYHGFAIACWGLGETGTAGATWFLANKSGELSKALQGDYDEDFVALLRFPMGEEKQGQLIRVYRPDDMHQFATHL